MCTFYNITIETLAAPGKMRQALETRAVAALLVPGNDTLNFTALGDFSNRDLATLIQAATGLRKRAAKDNIEQKHVAINTQMASLTPIRFTNSPST